ncbi:hypothetical protein HPB50_005357 [Hyalomma asiaticum]|uniref:Uncharacterized protein n=1 Tax=Hyalomma asiaticum TaxID=266040 RepID=A0ACB7SET8_HYAAI|nr:hypothetical protein HPB50_005357 [Hyalomma asiaticum]
MQRLRSNSSESSSEELQIQDGPCWSRFRKRIFITATAVILGILITALAVPLSKATSSKSTWLSWRERVHDTGVPRILLWTPAAAQRGTFGPVKYFTGSWPFNCTSFFNNETITCELTTDHGRTNDSDALVFFGDSITAPLLPLFRRAEQMWVFWATADLPPREAHENLSQILGLFNWTMGRRKDADVTIAYKTWECYGADEDDNSTRHATEIEHKGYAAWIVGECEQWSFIDASKEFMDNGVRRGQWDASIPVHLVLDCGSKHCGSRWNCVRDIAQKYHFIIVSDMPECYQSVSEIVYDAFKYDVVPVILTTEASLDFPPMSVISFSTKRNPGELASYLRLLLKFPQLYRQYFEWKYQCNVEPPRVDGLCPLCGALYDKQPRKSRTTSVLDWWQKPKDCKNRLLPILKNASFIN